MNAIYFSLNLQIEYLSASKMKYIREKTHYFIENEGGHCEKDILRDNGGNGSTSYTEAKIIHKYGK